MSDLTVNYFISHGDVPDELRVTDQSKFYVVRQTWEGKKILNTESLFAYKTKAEAGAKCKEMCAKK